ncbi:MAG: hypothetical protein QOJ06_1472 [Pseudonocardiales bacterium]|nr:hypothetical protein [Pseudonocardiales bacterium]
MDIGTAFSFLKEATDQEHIAGTGGWPSSQRDHRHLPGYPVDPAASTPVLVRSAAAGTPYAVGESRITELSGQAG